MRSGLKGWRIIDLAGRLDLPAAASRPIFAFNRSVVAVGFRSGYGTPSGLLAIGSAGRDHAPIGTCSIQLNHNLGNVCYSPAVVT